MDPGQTRVLLQDETVFFRRVIPFSLQFEGFRVEFMRLVRVGCGRCQFLRRPGGEIGIRVDRHKEDVGIAREFTIQETKKIYRRIRVVLRHGAAHAGEPDLPFKVFVCNLRRGLPQDEEGFDHNGLHWPASLPVARRKTSPRLPVLSCSEPLKFGQSAAARHSQIRIATRD